MKKELMTKGYKVTDSKMKCRGFQFELGKRFKETGILEICENGFHFCELASDCFNYYDFDSSNRVFEVLGYGDLDTRGDKHACLEIEFIREFSWLEVLNLVNTGKENTGRANTGDSNTGYRNTGAFCTNNNPKVLLFDNETGMSVREWEEHEAMNIMSSYLEITIFVYSSSMTKEEKVKYPTHETIGGYLKSFPYKEAWSNMWHNLNENKRSVFTSLPNFNAEKFLEITGIDISK